MKIIKRVVGVMLLIVVCILFVYLFIDYRANRNIVSIYNSVGNSKLENTSGSKKLNFLVSYYAQTNDLQLSKELGNKGQGSQGMSQSGGQSNVNPDPDPPPPTSGDDIRGAAMAVANTFKKPAGSGYSFPKNTPGLDKDDFFNYSQSGGGLTEWDNGNGAKHKSPRRDCSQFVCEVLKYIGVESSIKATLQSSNANTKGTDVTSSLKTMNDLEVGDILWRANHIAIVTYKDSDTVYVGDFGSATTSDGCKAISHNGDNTAARGWAYSWPLTQAWSAGASNQKEYTKVYRP